MVDAEFLYNSGVALRESTSSLSLSTSTCRPLYTSSADSGLLYETQINVNQCIVRSLAAPGRNVLTMLQVNALRRYTGEISQLTPTCSFFLRLLDIPDYCLRFYFFQFQSFTCQFLYDSE
ncbi:hypothetical protein KIN20_004458 [Parelaphostrongylus tenuis]|uniref:Uncharacterized protein n=1 Tax=Parelaphostrongylus tenuis TaxID=148309 RepID=A0AAD5QJB0_PARTN|nr:hypothetical protein KIN20_004458 [Parelaphostrongylus tenuis]